MSLSSSKEIEKKDTLGQNPFDINIKTIIAFHHIMKFEKCTVGYKRFVELCTNMLPPVNVKAFNSMQSKIADAYVNISKLSMTEAGEDLRLNNIHENLKTRKLMLQIISQKFNISVKQVCRMQLQALLYCNRMICFYVVFHYNTKDAS